MYARCKENPQLSQFAAAPAKISHQDILQKAEITTRKNGEHNERI